jgi:hypothetical protein
MYITGKNGNNNDTDKYYKVPKHWLTYIDESCPDQLTSVRNTILALPKVDKLL